jgi:D-tyrosyl-tRNA(Tyr) deacylase
VLLQRVLTASVDIDGQRIASIGPGLLAFIGISTQDTSAQVSWLADKTLGLRIFADADKPMNKSVVDAAGEILVVSQFTLTADTSRGRRPGFSTSAPPQIAEPLYQEFVDALAREVPVQTGRFGADMQVALVNDGPVTFLLER